MFGAERVLIVSNSAGSSDDKGFEEARQIEDAFCVPVLKHPASKKPDCIQDIVAHFSLTTPAAQRQCVVFGDRVRANRMK